MALIPSVPFGLLTAATSAVTPSIARFQILSGRESKSSGIFISRRQAYSPEMNLTPFWDLVSGNAGNAVRFVISKPGPKTLSMDRDGSLVKHNSV
jgi:hypothetical protein